jgi:hypothetical protein
MGIALTSGTRPVTARRMTAFIAMMPNEEDVSRGLATDWFGFVAAIEKRD